MSNPPQKKIEAVSEEEPVFFKFSATLRIRGDGLDIDDVSRTLGLKPTHSHRKGEQRHLSRPNTWPHDMWSYQAPIDREKPLQEHIMTLWDAIRPHIPYLRELKKKFHVDVFCGYRSNSDTAGFEVDYRCLGLFSELEVPFGVSVIVS